MNLDFFYSGSGSVSHLLALIFTEEEQRFAGHGPTCIHIVSFPKKMTVDSTHLTHSFPFDTSTRKLCFVLFLVLLEFFIAKREMAYPFMMAGLAQSDGIFPPSW